LERPVIVPLLHLTIWLSPLLWLSNLMSYLNGSALLSTKSSGFAGTETWQELDFVARFQLQASPAVMARGMLGMLRYDATAVLKTINVPALVLAGDRDSVCKPEASERMYRDIPGAQHAQLAPAKHMGLIEHHWHFAKIVSEFAALADLQLASFRIHTGDPAVYAIQTKPRVAMRGRSTINIGLGSLFLFFSMVYVGKHRR
jgi:pimeloyl-ACP methyl ester carboxylesterase